MSRLLRMRPFLSPWIPQSYLSIALRAHPPPSRPTVKPFNVTARSCSLSQPPPTRPLRCKPPSSPFPPPLRVPPPPHRSTPHLTLLFRRAAQRQPQQQFRSYNQNHHHDPYDPHHRATRLATAKPLVHWRGWRALNTPSTYTVVAVAVSGALIFYFSNLETVPVSGRTRFNVYSPDSVRKVGEMEYKRVLWELEQKGVRVLPEWDPRTLRVKRVMQRLIPFSGLQGEDWEVYVVDDPHTANAFVIPGGKVFVFSGILPLARNDSGLATVLGHEIAHNLADHHGERLSQDLGASVLLYSLVIMGGVFGLGPFIMHFFGSRFMDVAFGFPMSRLQESEADYIGLMMMAEACYDPSEAASFWARMERAQGQEVPEWMSTHPTNVSRIKKIQEWLPKAIEKRAQSDCSSTTAFADLFRQALRTGQVIVLG